MPYCLAHRNHGDITQSHGAPAIGSILHLTLHSSNEAAMRHPSSYMHCIGRAMKTYMNPNETMIVEAIIKSLLYPHKPHGRLTLRKMI